MNQSAVLMLHKNKTVLVKAKFRPRIRCNGRLTNRIGCMKERRERDVGNISFDKCKDGCKDAAKIDENGVWCSFGQEEKKKETTNQ